MAKRKKVLKGKPVTRTELRSWRRARGWTQQQAAEYLEVSKRSIENWEQGYRPVRHSAMLRSMMQQHKLPAPKKPVDEQLSFEDAE